MPDNKEEVKITVTNGNDEKSDPIKRAVKKEAPTSRQARGKQVTKTVKKVRKPAAQKAVRLEEKVSKQAAKKPAAQAKAKPARVKKGGVIQTIISVAVTAAIVGGGIYAWQQSATDKSVDEVKRDAEQAKMTFEERLKNLKNKLTGVESENIELQEKTKELEELTELLNRAKIDFSDESVGLTFTYPAVFGKATIVETRGATSTKFLGSFKDNDKLVFGGSGRDYARHDLESAPEFTELRGFGKKLRDYFLVGPEGQQYTVKPAQVIPISGGEALLVDANSFGMPEGEDPPVKIGQNVGIVVKLNDEKFSGAAFLNSDFGVLPLPSFIEMVKTIKAE